MRNFREECEKKICSVHVDVVVVVLLLLLSSNSSWMFKLLNFVYGKNVQILMLLLLSPIFLLCKKVFNLRVCFGSCWCCWCVSLFYRVHPIFFAWVRLSGVKLRRRRRWWVLEICCKWLSRLRYVWDICEWGERRAPLLCSHLVCLNFHHLF